MAIVFKIATEYTQTPGGRLISEGDYSGEEFRELYLKPLLQKAHSISQGLIIDLDGGYGYAHCFLEEAFGGLVRDTKDIKIQEITFISDEEPKLIDVIRDIIKQEFDYIKTKV